MLGGLLDLLSVLWLSIVAAFCSFLPSRIGCNSVEKVVMGDMYRYRNDANKLRRVQTLRVLVESGFS